MQEKQNPEAVQPEEMTEQQAMEEAVVEQLKLIDEQKAKIADLEDKYRRSLADFDNLRKRTRKEKEAVYPEAVSATVLALLPVLDNLERAAGQPSSDAAAKKGIELMIKQFKDILDKLGVKPCGAVGEAFDPNFHNAVAHVEDDNFEENTICEVLMQGYVMGERVVRHTMVKVAN